MFKHIGLCLLIYSSIGVITISSNAHELCNEIFKETQPQQIKVQGELFDYSQARQAEYYLLQIINHGFKKVNYPYPSYISYDAQNKPIHVPLHQRNALIHKLNEEEKRNLLKVILEKMPVENEIIVTKDRIELERLLLYLDHEISWNTFLNKIFNIDDANFKESTRSLSLAEAQEIAIYLHQAPDAVQEIVRKWIKRNFTRANKLGGHIDTNNLASYRIMLIFGHSVFPNVSKFKENPHLIEDLTYYLNKMNHYFGNGNDSYGENTIKALLKIQELIKSNPNDLDNDRSPSIYVLNEFANGITRGRDTLVPIFASPQTVARLEQSESEGNGIKQLISRIFYSNPYNIVVKNLYKEFSMLNENEQITKLAQNSSSEFPIGFKITKDYILMFYFPFQPNNKNPMDSRPNPLRSNKAVILKLPI